MKRFIKSTFFFMLGLSFGVTLSWTAFLEGMARIALALSESSSGPWIISFIATAVMVIFLVPSLVSKVARFFENTLKDMETKRRDTIKECVKLTLLELGYTKREHAQRNSKIRK